jgi:hypothetical protein
MNTQQRPESNAPEDYPPSLDGGEPRSRGDHRIGETQRQNPQVERVDPGHERPRQSQDEDGDEDADAAGENADAAGA